MVESRRTLHLTEYIVRVPLKVECQSRLNTDKVSKVDEVSWIAYSDMPIRCFGQ